MTAVSIIVITYARPALLRKCLDTCIAQSPQPSGGFEVVVVDNNPAASAEAMVSEIAATAPVPVRYVHEPTPGIPNARNAGIRATSSPVIGFVDDDQTLAPDWLDLMTRALEETGDDCMFSNVAPVYSEPDVSPPPAIERLYGRTAKSRATNGVLIRRETCITDPFPFDPQMMFTGGTDTDFFTRLASRGRSFGWCAEAMAWEFVPADRLGVRYNMKREFAGGQHFARTQIRYSRSKPLTAAKILAKAVLQTGGLGVAAAVSPLLGPDRRAFLLLRLAGAVGKLLWPVHFELRRRPAKAAGAVTGASAASAPTDPPS
ncbi:glycosyltransferase family 2 protein [Amorphus orientalis]|uniref:Glycosyltransferase involved in cell wall biosynthesis n=1 Tax=Amorphus orientalis TaxID=649198 RepID=A0AAE3VR08_9HYPH|nr:glycosyltransferase family 2 protein [Amorphus orientalis]MDQ0316595.1 glycosyltransferase involved in cell wall biosynthesis [Amorphus orientalis]